MTTDENNKQANILKLCPDCIIIEISRFQWWQQQHSYWKHPI